MKLVLFLVLGFGFCLAGAQSQQGGVKVVKTEIVCFADSAERMSLDDGRSFGDISVTLGKVSETLRSSWKVGNVEYRSSESKSFQDSELFSVSKNQVKVTEVLNENQLTITTKGVTHTRYLKTLVNGQSVREKAIDTVETYLVRGDERILLSQVVNGEKLPTYGYRETHKQTSATEKVVFGTESTPYFQTENKYMFEVLKNDSSCTYKEIQ